MKKKIFVLCAALAFLAAFAMPAFASENVEQDTFYAGKSYLTDFAGAFTEEQSAEILTKLQTAAAECKTDIAAATVTSLGKHSSKETAQNIYELSGYGENGMLLLLSIEDREWCIYTTDSFSGVITADCKQYIYEHISDYLSNDDYVSAIEEYAKQSEYLIDLYQSGTPYSAEKADDDNGGSNGFLRLIIALAVGAVAGFIDTGSMKGELNTVYSKSSAADYVIKNSLNVTESTDKLEKRDVKKTAKANSSQPSSSGKF